FLWGEWMEKKKRIARKKSIHDLNEKEFKLLLDLLEHYEKFKLLTWIMKWVILLVLAFMVEGSRVINAIDNFVTHVKKWFLKF
ncbi:hypothetical protein, partial [Bartonella queenslandensis]|uniref:hypothetical protein n=1 Tax=Bartonella queenslandensis TaxID=481138 RepID=UPI001FCA6C23